MRPIPLYILLALLLIQTFGAHSQSGHWQVLKTKNEPLGKSECGLAAVSGKLYLVGGEGSNETWSFDPKTRQWRKRTNAPVVLHHFQAVANGSKLYVLEAFSQGGFPNQAPTTAVYSYDTQKDSWHTGSGLPTNRRRAGAGAATYGGKLYLVAGIQHGHASGTTNKFDQYDPQTDTWTALPDAPHSRDHCSATVLNDKLYAVGGRNTSYHEPANYMAFFSHTVTDVDCYDFKTGTWSTLAAKLPLSSGGGAVVNFDNKLYYMGGERATATQPNGPQKNTYFLDPTSSNSWMETAPLKNGRNGMAAVVVNHTIYAAGGSGGGPGGPPAGGAGSPPFPTGEPPADSANRPGIPPGPPPPNGPNNKNKLIIEVFTLN